MHDLAMARKISDVVDERKREKGFEAVEKVEIRLGELLLLEPEQLSFWIREAVQQDQREPEVEVEQVAPRIECGCGYTGGTDYGERGHRVTASMLECPECGETNPEVLEGRECTIETIHFLED